MKWSDGNRRTLLMLAAGVVLVVGLSLAAWIYLEDQRESQRALVYEQGYGGVFQLKPEHSKKFIHDLQLYGGKANVFFYELTGWFEGLWHGMPLALIIAGCSVGFALGLYRAARREPPGSAPAKGGEAGGE